MLQLICAFCVCFAVTSAIDIYFINDDVGRGRRFDGIGGISGGGATSKLLISYPEPQRSHILDYLFKPNFGASLHILKVEIGGDAQSTDGTEASHMHNSWDENYERGYEWWLMVEAKKRNPNIKIYGLPWSFPGWLNPKGVRDPYQFPNITADYISRWIKGAKKHYNVTVDFIGIWNERHYDKEYIKTLRRFLDSSGLQRVRIVAPDAPHAGGNDWKICPDILDDPVLAAAVDTIGAHYPGTLSTPLAVKTGKALWASEDYSTFNDIVGGGCWARILNQNYVNGNITATISWNLIAAYYHSLPFTRDGLMTAENPWCGNYVVESPIWMTAHTTQFTEIGWNYLKHGHGSGHFVYGGSYVSLVSPDGKDLTVVIETMSHDHSECIRPPLPPYSVIKQNVILQLAGSFASITSLNVWNSSLRFDGQESPLFIKQDLVKVVNGSIYLTLNVDEVITLTTLDKGFKGHHPDPPPAKPFPLPFSENFDGFKEHEEASYFAQQLGSFEVMNSGEADHKMVMRQMVQEEPIYWCRAETLGMTANYIGSNNWTDIYIETDARLSKINGSEGVFVGSRVSPGGCGIGGATGVFLFVFPISKTYIVTEDLAHKSVLHSGSTGEIAAYDWLHLGLRVLNGTVVGILNKDMLFNITIPVRKTHGFAALGTSSFGVVDFDNVQIMDSKMAESFIYWKYQSKIEMDIILEVN